MFGTYYYNESMRKMTIAFGQLFNNIQIKRKDSAGTVVQSIRVDAKSDNQMLTEANSQGIYSSEISSIVPTGMPVSLSDASQAVALQQFKQLQVEKDRSAELEAERKKKQQAAEEESKKAHQSMAQSTSFDMRTMDEVLAEKAGHPLN